MNHQITNLHCGEHLKGSLKDEIDEVVSVVDLIQWEEEFKSVEKPPESLLRYSALTINYGVRCDASNYK